MPGLVKFAQFLKEVSAGTVASVYLFDGEEAYFHEKAIRALGQAVVPEGVPELDREVLQGDEASLQEIVELASTYPMGSERRLIIVRAAGKLGPESIEVLKDYLSRPNPTTCLVFSDLRFDRRKTLYRELLKRATRVDCASIDDARATGWVRERLQERGFSIGADLAEAIVAGLAGDGLARMEAELEKLMSAVGEPRSIRAEDLSLLANVPRVGDAFLLARQILGGDRAAAVASLRTLLAAGEEPLMLLGGVSWYVRSAIKARAVRDGRVSPREMGDRYGIDAGRVERFSREVGQVRQEDLTAALRLCLAADSELKGRGARNPANAFERLIHRIGRRVVETA